MYVAHFEDNEDHGGIFTVWAGENEGTGLSAVSVFYHHTGRPSLMEYQAERVSRWIAQNLPMELITEAEGVAPFSLSKTEGR